MYLRRVGFAGVIASLLAVPAFAQTTQVSPQGGPATSIPTRPGVTSGTAVSPLRSPRGLSGPVNINSASAADLDKLPGIGKVRADAIVKNRPYRSPEDLQTRHIVPPNVYNRIKNQVVTGPG